MRDPTLACERSPGGSRFPLLEDFLDVTAHEDGLPAEQRPPEEELRRWIGQWHPICLWALPRTAAECQEGLVVFQTEEALGRFFGRDMTLGSAGLPWLEWLPMIIEGIAAHMRERHPPVW